MTNEDIPAVVCIEQDNYHDPWTEIIFHDCLRVGYEGFVLLKNSQIIGYLVVYQVLDEIHLLNIAISKQVQHQGYGQYLLEFLISSAKKNKVKYIFLEVRVSNIAARKLYEKCGFQAVGTRKAYYPTETGREDAILYTQDTSKC